MPTRPAISTLLRPLLPLVCALACAAPQQREHRDHREPTPVPTRPQVSVTDDPHSYARAEQVVVRDLALDLRVRFADHRIAGAVIYRVERLDPSAPLRLDTRDLQIDGVETAGPPSPGAEPAWSPTNFELGDADRRLGSPLTIDLPKGSDRVRIRYQTAPEASGLQWLTPAQTSGDSPFLYSQSQAIHARSWIPCQDSPAIRTPIRATVSVDRPLRALMAANDEGITKDSEGTHYRFSLDQAIPAYLLAIAVGDLHKHELGPRTAVWAEPAVLPAAAKELAELETMLPAIEADFGPYRWGRYEVLILPPSFPFGGMENPIVTFATPTILAGDRSLISLIAHELAHSWSGNLVTNATWDDLWLNEGPTTYLERRIIEALYGRERAEMEATLGKELLLESLAKIPESEQSLRSSEHGRDPDAVFSDVAYEKGALFFRLLEDTYGRERFDPFLRAWFDEHAFTSQTTAAFVEFTRTRLLDVSTPLPGHQAPDLDLWIYGPGLQSDVPNPQAESFIAVEADAAAWSAGTLESRALGEKWSPLHWMHFIDHLSADVSATQLADLDAHHELTQSDNRELLAAWLEISIRAHYSGVDQRLRWFLTTIGRRKYLTTLYRALLETDGNSRRARSIYDEARPTYQAIARETIEAMLGIDNDDR